MESSNDQAVILIAEGKDSVRKTVQFMLQSHGYVPLTAYAAAAALDISRRRPGRADLLPSDVRMLGSMNSVALARELTRE